jgi:hypothetical protein
MNNKLLRLKVELWHAIREKMDVDPESLSEAEADMLFAISKDKDIQALLDKVTNR